MCLYTHTHTHCVYIVCVLIPDVNREERRGGWMRVTEIRGRSERRGEERKGRRRDLIKQGRRGGRGGEVCTEIQRPERRRREYVLCIIVY